MRARLTGALLAAVLVAALPASALGQDPPVPGTPTPTPTPTATPTPTPTPTPEELEEAEERDRLRKKKVVRRVYADFRRDGRVDGCDHTRKSLRETLKSIDPEFEQDFPDFREAVEAQIKRHDSDRCEEEPEPTPTPSPTPAPTSPPSTPPPTTPDPGPDPVIPPPPADDGGGLDLGDGDDGGAFPPPPEESDPPPPTEGDVTPVQPAPTPAPPATPPVPQEAQLVVTRPDGDSSLLVPALLLGLALLGLAAAGGTAAAARRGGPFAGWGHAWREATYRASGAWGDFGDWLRLGR